MQYRRHGPRSRDQRQFLRHHLEVDRGRSAEGDEAVFCWSAVRDTQQELVPGGYTVVAQVTETVTTLNGKRKVKTPTTVEATIPLTIT